MSQLPSANVNAAPRRRAAGRVVLRERFFGMTMPEARSQMPAHSQQGKDNPAAPILTKEDAFSSEHEQPLQCVLERAALPSGRVSGRRVYVGRAGAKHPSAEACHHHKDHERNRRDGEVIVWTVRPLQLCFLHSPASSGISLAGLTQPPSFKFPSQANGPASLCRPNGHQRTAMELQDYGNPRSL